MQTDPNEPFAHAPSTLRLGDLEVRRLGFGAISIMEGTEGADGGRLALRHCRHRRDSGPKAHESRLRDTVSNAYPLAHVPPEHCEAAVIGAPCDLALHAERLPVKGGVQFVVQSGVMVAAPGSVAVKP
jgi:hypothetical protein